MFSGDLALVVFGRPLAKSYSWEWTGDMIGFGNMLMLMLGMKITKGHFGV